MVAPSPELLTPLAGLVGALGGAWLKSVYDSRNSASTQATTLLEARDREISLLRRALDHRHTHLSAYARTLEVVLLAWKLPLPEQIETIRQARERLTEALNGFGGGGAGGK